MVTPDDFPALADRPCPECRHRLTWRGSDAYYLSSTPERSFPIFALKCRNCGHESLSRTTTDDTWHNVIFEGYELALLGDLADAAIRSLPRSADDIAADDDVQLADLSRKLHKALEPVPIESGPAEIVKTAYEVLDGVGGLYGGLAAVGTSAEALRRLLNKRRNKKHPSWVRIQKGCVESIEEVFGVTVSGEPDGMWWSKDGRFAASWEAGNWSYEVSGNLNDPDSIVVNRVVAPIDTAEIATDSSSGDDDAGPL